MFGDKYVGIEGCPAAEPRSKVNRGSVQSANVDRHAPPPEHCTVPERRKARLLHCAPEIRVRQVP